MHYCTGGPPHFSHDDRVDSTLSDQLCTRPIFSMIPSIFPPDSSPCAQPSVLTKKNLQTIANLRLFYLTRTWHKVTLSCQIPHYLSDKFIFLSSGNLFMWATRLVCFFYYVIPGKQGTFSSPLVQNHSTCTSNSTSVHETDTLDFLCPLNADPLCCILGFCYCPAAIQLYAL